MTLASSASGFRSTTPRPTAPSGFGPLLARVKEAGLLRRSQFFYL